MTAARRLPNLTAAPGAHPHPHTEFPASPASAGTGASLKVVRPAGALHLDPGPAPACLKPSRKPQQKRSHQALDWPHSFRDDRTHSFRDDRTHPSPGPDSSRVSGRVRAGPRATATPAAAFNPRLRSRLINGSSTAKRMAPVCRATIGSYADQGPHKQSAGAIRMPAPGSGCSSVNDAPGHGGAWTIGAPVMWARRSTAVLMAVPASCASVGCASSPPAPLPPVMRPTLRRLLPRALPSSDFRVSFQHAHGSGGRGSRRG
jgi:hypothetical protein